MHRPTAPTWYVLSNLSYMNRVMMLVLPTDWSPRKTCAVVLRVESTAPSLSYATGSSANADQLVLREAGCACCHCVIFVGSTVELKRPLQVLCKVKIEVVVFNYESNKTIA